jgi:hypothetical protein
LALRLVVRRDHLWVVAHPRSLWPLTCAGALLLGACGDSVSPQAASIESFAATPASLVIGDSTTLAWTVTNADSLRLEPGIGPVTGTAITLAPAVTTRFVLHAIGPGGADSAEATVTVIVPAPPAISAFAPAAASIVAGGATTLNWSVAGADSLTVDHGVGRVVGAGLTVTPAATTTYTLVAFGRGGSTTNATTVSVVPAAAPPPAPANVRALGTGGGGVVLWDPVPFASGYVVEASTQGQPAFTTIATPGATHPYAACTCGNANSINTYRVYALNAAGSSSAVQVSALVAPPPPEGPSLAVVPSSLTVARGDSVLFSVTPVSAVTWLLAPGAFGGRLSPSGWYTAPATPGSYLVLASGSIAAGAGVTVP